MNQLKSMVSDLLSNAMASHVSLGNRPKTSVGDLGISTESLDKLDLSPYQAEIKYNRLLPYADKLDQEADRLFAEIKANLAKCVMLGDIQPGIHSWTLSLFIYIRLYGLRFTKEEHILLVKLYYELLVASHQDAVSLEKFGPIFVILLQKKELLSQNDLELPWRPLYDLCVTINKRSSSSKTMYKYPDTLQILEDVIQVSKLYFPPTATQEILDEIRPKLYYFSRDSCLHESSLKTFLPVQLPVDQHSIGHELWFHEFMKYMDTQFENVQSLEKNLMTLMAELASNNIGYIDWNPYIPAMFTRFLYSMKMPMKFQEYGRRIGPDIDRSAMAEWIASVLGDKTNAQAYLEKFLKTLETYFHSANTGRWSMNLQILFNDLPRYVSMRLYRERHEKQTWLKPIPDSHKLTDENVDAFVESMMPIATIVIFNRMSSARSNSAFKYLAEMRPNVVIPKILEKLYPLLEENTIERNKLSSVFACVTAMIRPLVQGLNYFDKKYAYPEGPTHVFNFLFAALSAINMNEFRNCFAAMIFIKTCLSMIPVVDCSNSKLERSEEDNLICELTARFEDFILQFMDKIYALIKSGTHVSVRIDNASSTGMDMFESMSKSLLVDTIYTLQLRMSDDFFTVALNKLYSFVREDTLETQVAGKIMATLCNSFSLKNGELVLHLFVPNLTDRILNYLLDHDTADEQPDDQLLYPLMLLRSVLDTQGSAVLPHIDTLIPVIDKVLSLKNQEVNKVACRLLENLLSSLSTIQVIGRENDTVNDPEHPHWEDWGQSVDVESFQLKWYVPGEQELAAADKLFQRYFFPAMSKVQNYIKAADSLSRKELRSTLRLIFSCLMGCKKILPKPKEEPIFYKGYENIGDAFSPYLGLDYEITMPDGNNVKHFVVQVMTDLQDMMLKNIEDDTDCFSQLLKIWTNLTTDEYQSLLATFKNRTVMSQRRKALQMKIIGDKGMTPGILQKRVHLQHDWRETGFRQVLTQTTEHIILNLFKLCIHKYKEIRIIAQSLLKNIIKLIPRSENVLIPHLLEILQSDTDANEDAYIGVLSLIQSLNLSWAKNNWQMLSKLIPAMILAKPTEKLEAISVFESIVKQISRLSTIMILQHMPDTCVPVVSKLLKVGLPPSETLPDGNTITNGQALVQERGHENLQAYYDMLDQLIDAVSSGKLHWRHCDIATQFVEILIHPEYPLPIKVVRYFFNALIHDSLNQRFWAWHVTGQILHHLKRKHPKKAIEVPSKERILEPGIRADNEWLLYDSTNWPTTAEKWDTPRYVHKESVGFYAWPKKLEVYAPSAEQPSLDRSVRQMNELEKEVGAFFGNAQNVAQLVKFLSLEEKKDVDTFNPVRTYIFEGLFRNHGDDHLAQFLPHLRKLVMDSCESSQRCAAEIICGLIRGSKHWPFDKTKAMWSELLPIIKLVLNNANVEAMNSWLRCFENSVSGRDPNRMFWLIEFIKEEAVVGGRGKSTINEQMRLKIFNRISEVHPWRMNRWLYRLLPEFKSYLYENPLKGVRDALAPILTQIYSSYVLCQIKQEREEYPKIIEFINPDQPLLKNLLDDNSEDGRKLLQTLCDMILTWYDPFVFDKGSFYELYPIFVKMTTSETYPELAKSCRQTIALLASSRRPEHIPVALKAINEVSKSASWSERVSTIQFIEVMLFYNMNLVLSNQDWLKEIRSIVLRMLEDERVEVRDVAAKVLSGMVHCTLITDRQTLLDKFIKMAKKKNHNKSKESTSADSSESIRLRHAGVLGMCAFIQAHPYDIPKDIPPIFEYLSLHLHEPEPILGTIRKTLSDFKRTHCDTTAGLQGLAEQLTPKQFEILQDLNVPPSYFS